MSDDDGQKLDIDWLKTIAGALAAVSSAVLLSTLGAAGTIIGAALGSVIATVGGAVYAQGLATSKEQLARAQNAARTKVGLAQAEVLRANRRQGDDTAVRAHLAEAEEQLDEARTDLEALESEPQEAGWRDRLAALPWKRIAVLAGGIFATAVIAITAFELTTGSSVSEITGGSDEGDGTTISRIGGGADDQKDESPTQREDERGDEPSSEPSSAPTEDEPTDEPSEAPSEEPSLDPSPSPSLPTTSPQPSESPAG